MNDVAIIVINYNTSKYTLECLQSIQDKTCPDIAYQIIVIDNNSELEDYKNLETNFPKQENLILHRSTINTGFGGGNMLGVARANARYLLFLNNDTILLNDSIKAIISYLKAKPEVGLCGAQNFNELKKPVPSFDQHKTFWRLLLGRSLVKHWGLSKSPNRKIMHNRPIEVDWVHGSFMFFRSEAFKKIGGFDPNIFLYFEEMDLCLRLSTEGYKTVFVPEAKICHLESKSTQRQNRIGQEALLSHFYVLKKHYGWFHYKAVQFYYLITLSVKPKKHYLIPTTIHGLNLKKSLKHQQKAAHT